MRVLVTGGSSLLGGAVATRLAQAGHEVSCFQRSASKTGLRDVRGDVRDAQAVLAAADGAEAVVHLAALVAPRLAWTDAYRVNVTGTDHVRRAAQRAGRFVHVSSPSVAFHDLPAIGESAGPPVYAGRDAYTRSKALAEQLVLRDPTVPTVVVRPHLVWGPGDTQLVGRVLARARQGRLAVPDHGRALVDTTYLDDAAAAIAAALSRAVEGDEACGRAWVVTGADPRPVAELLGGILRAAGLPDALRSVPAPLLAAAGRLADRWWPGTEPPVTYFAARQLSVAHWFDQHETQRVLGWSPQVTVDEGLERLAASLRAS
jgi:nucleoside-diphosphate-sugar epimerase